MKQCPKCNTQYNDAWLSFCPQDGTILVESVVSTFGRDDVSAPPSEDATLFFRPPVEAGSWAQPDVYTPPQVWQPPPPPAYVKPPSQGIAIASMVTGILSLLFGILCFGPVIGIISVALGIVALTQHKKTPQLVGGKPFAIVGIVTGALALLLYGGMTIFFLVLSNL
jgi:Domain of unknown function (DUF4190)